MWKELKNPVFSQITTKLWSSLMYLDWSLVVTDITVDFVHLLTGASPFLWCNFTAIVQKVAHHMLLK